MPTKSKPGKTVGTMHPRMLRITRIIDENSDTKTFHLSDNKGDKNWNCDKFMPGNFIMLWVPLMSNDSVNYKIPDQIPMGISSVIDKNTFAITVRKIDEVNKKTTTSEFHKYSVGDYVGITGPLGNHFRITGDRILIIGGGTGIAPLRFLAKTINAANRNEKNKDIKNTHR